ncbi:MAG: hydrolase [Hydrogenoanaerobacterium sp.]
MSAPFIPEFQGNLRKHSLIVPECIRRCTGIKVFGKRMKSIVFTTDVSIIRNVNADAVIAVYPFTPQPIITQSLMLAADIPVFCGVGGGLTMGKRVINLALHAEFQGAIGVVLNAPTSNETLAAVREEIDLPVVITVVSEKDDIAARIKSGASIINVSAAANTVELVHKIRSEFPELAIMATGGPTDESILNTIEAGANAITWTPPTNGQLFKVQMERYRQGLDHT